MENNGTWFLAGIQSVALKAANYSCDLNNFIIFTDVQKYLGWIEEEILNP
jgi:hypothetical protein